MPPPGLLTGRHLSVTGVVYAVAHHLGLLPDGLGQVPGTATRATDWLDLLVPYALLGPLGLAFAAAGLSRRQSWVTAAGGVMYASGHGIHLAANSIANLSPTGEIESTAHLWDEVVGHLVWYAGTALLLAVAATVLARLGAAPPAAHAVALAVGASGGTNAVGGGTSVLSAATALALVAYGLLHRSSAALVLVPGFGLALAVILGAGVLG
jgi:hypothetical protein